MKREIRGITFFSLVWEIIIFGGFISANELGIKNLVQAYEWFFYFIAALAILEIFFCSSKSRVQYTKARYHWKMITNILLGIMLAYYGYFICASILTFFGCALAQQNYFNKEKENEKIE